MYCTKCGTNNSESGSFCTRCGAKLPVIYSSGNGQAQNYSQPGNQPPKTKKRTKAVIIILAVLVVGLLAIMLIPDDENSDETGKTEFAQNEGGSGNGLNSGNGGSGNNGTQNNGNSGSTNSDNGASNTNNSGTGSGNNGSGAAGETINVGFRQDKAAQELSDAAVREHLVTPLGGGKDKVTIMIYMNGSDLESEYGEATTDLSEMIAAGSSDKVNVIVETVGTKKWQNYNISNRTSQIYELNGDGMKLVKDDLGQLDCTDPKTLSSFIAWSAVNYPADRYCLIFWDHGGGPVYGFGYDQYQEDYACLSVDEIQAALKSAGVYFDFIGMDCCIMSCMEMCLAVYDYCDYTILSEDFESGIGWYYTEWLKMLYANTSVSTPELGKKIVDDMVNANVRDKQNGDKSILTVIDESMMKVLYKAWTDFAYANEDKLLGSNYSRKVVRTRRARPVKSFFSDWLEDYSSEEYSLNDYYISDILALAENLDSEESRALKAAVGSAIVYSNACGDSTYLTGISVTLPYGDAAFYRNVQEVFFNCGIDAEYIDWLGKFVGESSSDSFYDYDSWDDEWSGWDEYLDDYDWSDWDFGDDDDYWDSYSTDWDDWDYSDSFNEWYDESDWDYDDSWNYEGDDWYYSDWFSDWYDYDSSYYDDRYDDWDFEDWDYEDWDFEDWDYEDWDYEDYFNELFDDYSWLDWWD